MHVTRIYAGFFLSHCKYTSSFLRKFHMHTCKLVCTPYVTRATLSLSDGELLVYPIGYRSMVGALQYLTMIPLDMAYVVHVVF